MAGTFIDGSTVYVGKGTSTSACANSTNMPARITTATGSAGAHMACNDALDSATPFYLKDNPRLIWVKTEQITAYMNPVLVAGAAYEFNIGRVNLLNGATTYQQIGKIHTVPNLGFWYGVGTTDKTTTDFERLVCDGPPPCQAPTAAPPGKHWEGPPTCAFVCNNTKPATIPDIKYWNETTCTVECKVSSACSPGSRFNEDVCQCFVIPPCSE
jgi:hypothetical protein